MKLEISVIKHRGNPPFNKQDYLFNQEGGSIGRSEENTWPLPDERKFLSRVQASIIFQNDTFHLVDKSSNGCFINQSNTPIGQGSSHKLSNNDVIRMGEYELQVNYVELSDVNDNNSSYDMFASDSHSSFPSNNISQIGISNDDPFGDVFRPKYENENNYVKPDVDSSFNSSMPISMPPLEKHTTTAVNKKENAPPSFNPIESASPPPSPSEIAESQDSDDIDSLFNTSKQHDTKNAIEKPIPPNKEHLPLPAEESGGFTQIFGGKESLESTPSSLQTKTEEPNNFFDIESKNDILIEENRIENKKKDSKDDDIENDVSIKPSTNEDDFIFSKKNNDFTTTTEEKNIPQNTSSPSSLFDNGKPNDIFNIEDKNNDNIIEEKTSKTSETEVKEMNENDITHLSAIKTENKPIEKKQIPIAEEDSLLFEELFKAAGIDTKKVKIEATKETAILIGQVLQKTLQGTMDLLRSRAETKDVFRVSDKTIISVARNNPLKFLPTTEYVITQLILSNENQLAYTPLVEAVEESFDDLKAHQFALSMSIQEALSSTIKDYFSPKNLQKKLEQSGSIGSKLPWQKKANLWKLFETAYDGIEEEASEQFQLVLERKIADAYEFHMQQIKQQRS